MNSYNNIGYGGYNWCEGPNNYHEERRCDAIESYAEDLMNDQDWVRTQFEDGSIVCTRELNEAISKGRKELSLIGDLLVDALWEIAHKQAEDAIDNP